jgi:hypothetical protein
VIVLLAIQLDTFQEHLLAACAFLCQDAEFKVTSVKLLPNLLLCSSPLFLEHDENEVALVEQRP